MTKVVPHTSDGWAVSEGTSLHRDKEHNYTSGIIRTRMGIVDVYAQSDNWGPVTMMEIIHAGRTYRRHWKCTYTERYMVTLAKRFYKEVIDGDAQG
jgi:hypothetical protein